MMRLSRKTCLLVSLTAAALVITGPAKVAAADPLAATLDAMLARLYPPDAPGAAVIAVRDGKTVLRKGYGMADMELGVPVQPDMVFRIASMTKQFTAVAILMLVDEGRLALTDPVSRFLPDYPNGERITVEHLLSHTSGIRSCIDDPALFSHTRKDYTVNELIDHFKNEPVDFAPGERCQYCNAGYVLLGAIIETASGTSYETFLKKRIFDVAGMTRTTFDSNSRIIPRRVRGYDREGDTWRNADWFSTSRTFSAGEILSTVDDLARWDVALYGGKFLRVETLQKAFTRRTLADGKSVEYTLPSGEVIEYGYGWQLGQWEGLTIIQHGGRISGFTSIGVRVPERRVYVAILSNREAGPERALGMAHRITSYLVEKPWEPKRIKIAQATLDSYAGVYGANPKGRWWVKTENGRLFTQAGSGKADEALPMSESDFFYEGSLERLRFERDAKGRVAGIVRQAFGGSPTRFARTADGPKSREAVHLTPEQIERCLGRYQLAPGFVLTITREDQRVLSQLTGQESVEIFAESEKEFFLKVVDAQLTFKFEGDGPAQSLVIHQGGQDMPARRLE
jgi:D-alanyl-D-alanine carboxypeptidase